MDMADNDSAPSKSKILKLYKKIIFKDGKFQKILIPFQVKDSLMVFDCECGCRSTIALNIV